MHVDVFTPEDHVGDAIEITGSGKTIGSNVAGDLGSHSVCPVCTFFMPTIIRWFRSVW
jgi:hypothetical protein